MLAELQFDSLQEFLAMGGYAFNVWSVYALFAVFVFANLALPLRRRRLILRRLAARGDLAQSPAAAEQSGWEVSTVGEELQEQQREQKEQREQEEQGTKP